MSCLQWQITDSERVWAVCMMVTVIGHGTALVTVMGQGHDRGHGHDQGRSTGIVTVIVRSRSWWGQGSWP